MLDPFPVAAPAPLVNLVKPFADAASLPTLPYHAHEVLFSIGVYSIVGMYLSPLISTWLFPDHFPKLSYKTKINWNVHVVSFVQSITVCSLSLYLMFYDEERRSFYEPDMWKERIWGYTGLSGFVQSMALGYFLWDLVMCAVYVNVFGWGMLAHAVAAVTVFSLGFRPFVHFYCPVFLLYELSSPALNIHWFLDKLELTGSVYQAINGAVLTSTFFGCRLVWGALNSYWVFSDMYHAVQAGHSSPPSVVSDFTTRKVQTELAMRTNDAQMQSTAFLQMGQEYIPMWLVSAYIVSNTVLNLLNYYWFSKMIQTIRKRFDPPFGTKGVGSDEVHYEPKEKGEAEEVDFQGIATGNDSGKGSVTAARKRAEATMGNGMADAKNDEQVRDQRFAFEDDTKGSKVTGSQRKTRRKA